MTNSLKLLGMILFFAISIQSCRAKKQTEKFTDSPSSGTIRISVDESFRPVIAEEIKMYEATYPGVHIIADYKPEAGCIRDLVRDSATRMIIVTRGLTVKEERYFEDSIGFVPKWDRIARDAVVIVINTENNDSLYTYAKLKDIMTGKAGRQKQVVFDGLNATSTIRFAMDSILRGESFDTSVVKAVSNSNAVLDYVAAEKNAIGMVGFSWIGNPEDTAQLNRLKKVKLAYVQCELCEDKPFVKPTQTGIMTMRYPLVRGLYYILKENHNGVGSGFTGFMKYERGQLIFKRAYLVPLKMGFNTRSVRINEKLVKD